MPLRVLLEGQILPVCVDLDGTLIQRNSVWAMWSRYRAHRKSVFRALWSGIRAGTNTEAGEGCFSWAAVKRYVARETMVYPSDVAFFLPLLHALYDLREAKVPLFLLTGADQKVAESLVRDLDLFHEIKGSNGREHFVGAQKAAYACRAFGPYRYTYIGDSWRDIPVWKKARNSVYVRENPLLIRYLMLVKRPEQRVIVFP